MGQARCNTGARPSSPASLEASHVGIGDEGKQLPFHARVLAVVTSGAAGTNEGKEREKCRDGKGENMKRTTTQKGYKY